MADELDRQQTLGHRSGICTLFEGDYHIGVAALVNSLVNGGFGGTIWVGYRGALPPWLDQLQCLDAERQEYLVAKQAKLCFVPVESDWHFTNFKPQFMLDLLARHSDDCDYLWYFDPDIYLRCGWAFFAKWERYGIALCEDLLYTVLPANNLLRQQWVEIAYDMGLGEPKSIAQHFNGGMAGVPASCASFLHLWHKVLEQTAALGYDLRHFLPGTRELPLHATDQDALNIAAMYTDCPLSTLGPEAMGFVNGGFTMYHAVILKPWRGSIMKRALAGHPPSNAVKQFFDQVSFPIRVYSPAQLRAKRLACAAAGFIGRFYGRR
jgi:hypothetical protein